MTAGSSVDHVHHATILDAHDPADAGILAGLRADAGIEFIDRIDVDRPETGTRWAYYPWRRAVVRVLDREEFRRVRLDRNRHLITSAELDRLAALRIGIVGLSVGHAIAHTLAMEGLCGGLRLADFDVLELTNLNRVPATVFDLGVNKAVTGARRIAELDPYLSVEVLTSGITDESLDAFLDGLDIVIEECDSLDVKVLVRTAARERGLPVLMATSSGGLLDVERFDLDPARPVFHGLLGDVDAHHLASLSSKDKVPHVLRVIDAAELRPRMQASLIEVGKTLSTWPQLSSEVSTGAASVAEAVRRIGLGEDLGSGRVRVDVPALLDGIDDPARAATANTAQVEMDLAPTHIPDDPLLAMSAAAARAPSGGNSQPWQLRIDDDALTIALDPGLTSAMDVAFRGSAVAVGAATFNARVAAAACGLVASVEFDDSGDRAPLSAVIKTGAGNDHRLATLLEPMLRRETNRHNGVAADIEPDAAAALSRVADTEGARLRLITAAADIDTLATLFAAADRIRYLTPHLHAEMVGELRWPGDPRPETGIDVRSLELAEADLTLLDILRNGAVMAHLHDWNAGSALGEPTSSAVRAASAVAVVSVQGTALTDYARGGAAAEGVWIAAQEHGLAVQPVSPAFLYARARHELDALSPALSQRLADLQYSFERFLDVEPGEALVLILRLCRAPRPSVQSRRRQLPGRSTPT